MSPVLRASLLVLFPAGAAVAGSVIAVRRPPPTKVIAAVQHFAAGVVLAALVGEVLPQLRDRGGLGSVTAGFASGVLMLLALEGLSQRLSPSVDRPAEDAPSPLPLGLVAVVGIDLVLDGLLVGLGGALGAAQGLILTVALTIEVLFVGLSVALTLTGQGQPNRRAIQVCTGLGFSTILGAVVGSALLGSASGSVLAFALAFAIAALLYLVVEELLVEAHEQAETWLMTAMFFVGFIVIYDLAAIGG